MVARCFLVIACVLCGCSVGVCQQAGADPGVSLIQPGAPGQPSTTLTAVTAVSAARPPSEADIRFMQDMIMHHGQAVEMTELLKTRSKDPEVQELGRKIDVSQSDEIKWMKQWLADRGIPLGGMGSMAGMDQTSMAGMDHSKMRNTDHASMAGMDHASMAGMDHASMAGMDHASMSGMDHGMDKMAGKGAGDASEKGATKHSAGGLADPLDVAMMPGMLSPRQMQTLRAANGNEFDVLFLTGMMQHHNGALLMVKQLFANPGAGQDAQLFDFASDVDNTQQAEIDIMKGVLRRVKP